jgi:hypothetical protein
VLALTEQRNWPTGAQEMMSCMLPTGWPGVVAAAVADSTHQALAAVAVTHDDLRLPQEWLRLASQLKSVVGADAVTALLSAAPAALNQGTATSWRAEAGEQCHC